MHRPSPRGRGTGITLIAIAGFAMATPPAQAVPRFGVPRVWVTAERSLLRLDPTTASDPWDALQSFINYLWSLLGPATMSYKDAVSDLEAQVHEDAVEYDAVGLPPLDPLTVTTLLANLTQVEQLVAANPGLISDSSTAELLQLTAQIRSDLQN